MSPQDIWQADQRDAPRLTLEYVQHRVSEFHGRNRAILRRILFCQLYVTPYFGWLIWTHHTGRPLMQAALTIAILAGWWGWWRLKQQMTPAPIDASAGVLDTLRYYRGELVRQLAVHNRRWRESIVINVVALPLLAIAWAVDMHRSIGFFIGMGVFVVVLSALVSWRVVRDGRRMRNEIHAVDLLAAG